MSPSDWVTFLTSLIGLGHLKLVAPKRVEKLLDFGSKLLVTCVASLKAFLSQFRKN